MSWRTVVVETRSKLDYKMGFLVVRNEKIERIYLDEIAILMIENPAVSLTGCLLNELIKKKIKVIFCDEVHSPISELLPSYGSYDTSRKIKAQIAWGNEIKSFVWTEIVAEKIRNQALFLDELGKSDEARHLRNFVDELTVGDKTNREGHAAKVYFNALFGQSFTRTSDNAMNSALNYGYSILLSAFNREIVMHGYLTQLGLAHDNMFNYYNLSCDLMEPFRILVDRFVFHSNFQEFGTDEKHKLLELVKTTITIDDARQSLLNGIKVYVRSVFMALNDSDVSKLKFYRENE